MKKNLLAAGVFFGLNRLLCGPPKKPGLFDNAQHLINANGILCGAIEKFTEENGHLYLENVLLDKNKIAEIFSGGFITKASQRIGMDFSINLNGEIKTYENVWADDMTSPREGKDAIKIEKMICSVEFREAPIEQTIYANENVKILVFSSDFQEVIGSIQSINYISNNDANPKLKINRLKINKDHIKKYFVELIMAPRNQKYSLNIQILAGNKSITFYNFWLSATDHLFENNECSILDSVEGESESMSWGSSEDEIVDIIKYFNHFERTKESKIGFDPGVENNSYSTSGYIRLNSNGLILQSSQPITISSDNISIGNRMVSSNSIKI